MPFKKQTPEEIIGKLREAEIVLAQGGTTADDPSPNFGPTFMRKTGSFCIRAGMPALMQKRAPLGFGCQGSCAVGLRYNLSATPHI